jgi:hypothetical protein
VDEDEDGESTLVASGLMRKAERPLPASFWKGRRGRLTLRKAVDALSKDREER